MYTKSELQELLRITGEVVTQEMPGCEGIQVGATARRAFMESFVTGAFEVVGFLTPKAMFFEGYSRLDWAQADWAMMNEEEKAKLEPGVLMQLRGEDRLEVWRPVTARIETAKEK